MSDPTNSSSSAAPSMINTPVIADLVLPLISLLEQAGISRVISSAFTLTVQGDRIVISKMPPATRLGNSTIFLFGDQPVAKLPELRRTRRIIATGPEIDQVMAEVDRVLHQMHPPTPPKLSLGRLFSAMRRASRRFLRAI